MSRANKARAILQKGFVKLGAGVSRVHQGMTQSLRGVAVVATAATAGVVLSVKKFAEFEEGLAKVGTLLDGGTKQAIGFTQDVESLSLQFAQSSGAMSDALFQTISASVKASESVDFLKEASKGASAGFTDAETSVNALTNVINAYGDALFVSGTAAQKAARINDAIFLANKFGKTTFSEIADNIGVVASTAALAGVDVRELTAAVATMTKAGVKTDMSMIALNQAILAFVKPQQEAVKLARQFGVELNVSTLKTLGLQGALALMEEKLGGNDEALAKIFGNVRSYRAAAILAGKGSADFARILDVTKNKIGITDEKFKDVSDTLGFKFRQSVQFGQLALTRIGQAFFKTFGSILSFEINSGAALDRIGGKAKLLFETIRRGFEILDLPGKFNAASAAIGGLDLGLSKLGANQGDTIAVASAIAAMTAALAPMALVVGPFISILTGLITSGGGAATVLAGLKAVIVGAAQALGGAFLPVALLVATAGNAIYKNYGDVRGALMQVWDATVSLGKALGKVIGVIFTEGKPLFEALSKTVGTVLAVAFKIFAGALKAVASAVLFLTDNALGPMLSVMFKVGTAITNFVNNALDAAIKKIRAFIGWVRNLVAEAKSALSAIGIGEQSASTIATGSATAAEYRTQQYQSLISGLSGGSIASAASGFVSGVASSSVGRAAQAIASAVSNRIGGQADASATANAKKRPCIEVDTRVKLDGKNLNVASSRARLELTERSGARVSPYQRRQIIERGSTLTAVAV